jgi:putative ABC transport system permease protein
LRSDFPQLQTIARSSVSESIQVTFRDTKTSLLGRYTDAEFFDIFPLSFVAGNAKDALRQPHSVVLTLDTAEKLFHSPHAAMGQRLLISGTDEVTVVGIVNNVRRPSHMQYGSQYGFDMLISMDVFEQAPAKQIVRDSWLTISMVTYVLLPADASFTAQRLIQDLGSFAQRHVPVEQCNCSFGAMPISAIPMTYANGMVGMQRTGLTASLLMYVLGGLVLFVTCMNYANLATAQAAARAKEIGMRRVVGASRGQVATQFLFEAALLVSFAMLGVIVLIGIGLAASKSSETLFVLQRVASAGKTWIGAALLLALTTLAAGAYPALFLSKIKPIAAVQAGRSKSTPRRMSRLLVGVQFTLASFLLIAVMVMVTQTAAMKRSATGGDVASLIVIENNLRSTPLSMESLRTQLLSQSHIKSVTGFGALPWNVIIGQLRISSSPDDSSPPRLAIPNIVGFDFFQTLDMKLIAGRVFDRHHADDISKWKDSAAATVLIDRAMAELQGWHDPEQAVGKTLFLRGALAPDVKPRPLHVVGVVEGKMLSIMAAGATSNVYFLDPDTARYPIIRIATDDVKAALSEIDQVWSKLAPNVAIIREYPQDIVDKTYKLIGGVAAAISVFSVLAGIGALLGLIGVSMHIIGRRTHEIGVRKTLGASTKSIFALLMRDFATPVVISNLIAWPFAFLAMRAYLNLFAERSALSIRPFLFSMIVSVLVAWLAVATQTLRAARIKPADVLRYE